MLTKTYEPETDTVILESEFGLEIIPSYEIVGIQSPIYAGSLMVATFLLHGK